MAMKLVVLVAVVLTSVSGVPLNRFYPFGFEAGDNELLFEGEVNDVSSPAITLSTPFQFFGVEHETLFVNENGVISFDNSMPQLTFEPFPLNESLIAPFWADVAITATGSIWYRETNETEILDRARGEIQSAFFIANQQTVNITHLFIATWDDVGYFTFQFNRDQRNTFQCILATNGENSFVTFLYADGGIQWTTGDADGGFEGFGGNPARVGLNAGDGIHFVNVPGSATSSIINIASTSNVCIAGMWIFRVDKPEFVTVGSSSADNMFIPAFTDFTRNASYFFNVSEDAYLGQIIGFVTAFDQDPGPAGSVAFTIVGDGSERFRIDHGHITLSVTLDRESTEQFYLTVVVQDRGEPSLSCSASLTINVTDVNDNPPVFTEDVYKFSVEELFATETLSIGNVTTEDRDDAENAETVYCFEGDQLFQAFYIDHFTGEIFAVSALDYESQSEYAGIILACNTQPPFECTGAPLLIRINDFNEDFPEFPQPTYRINITENYLVGTPLIRPVAYDGDTGSAGDITRYYILSEDSDLFDIEEDTGLVYLARDILATDVDQTYNFSVIAEDGGFPLRESNCTVFIHIDDITATSSRFNTSYNFFTWPETNATFDFMEQIPSTNLSGPFTFYPEESGFESPFNPLILSGNMQDTIVFLRFSFDREFDAEYYTVVLRSEDHEAFTSVTIRIIDENDNSPYFLLENFNFTVAENEMFSFSIGEFVVDRDADADNRRVIYTLSGDEGVFGIDNNGVISLRSTLDREANDFYALNVSIVDPGFPEFNFAVACVGIRVLDKNDNAPVFQNVVTGKTRVQVFGGDTIEEFSVNATDNDAGENALVVLYLEDADTLPFAIDPVSGLLTVKDGEDSNNLEERYSLVILAEDRGTPRLTSSATLDIQVFRSDALLVSVFPNLDGETFEGFGAQILPTDSVIRAELSRDILLSCSSITATESDIMWSSEGNITFDELTLSELLSGMEKFSGSGSDNTRAFEFQYDVYDEGGTDAPFMPFNASVIFAIISSDAINEGTLSCNSSQSGETVALHFSSDFCMCALPNQTLQDIVQPCDSANFTACSCTTSSFDCTCQQLTGDGDICTFDTDGDGFPNSIIPSCEDEQESYCTEDNCPDDFNPDQDARACEDMVIGEDFLGCPAENDTEWNIEWSVTLVGLFDTQPCIDGTVGNAIRLCISNQTWGSVNVTDCRSQEFEELVTEIQDVLVDETLTTEEVLEVVESVTESLINSTEVEEETQLYPREIQATNEIVEDVVTYLIDTVTEGITLSDLNTELVEVFDNILDEGNMDGWEQIEQTETGSQLLLNNAEMYGQYIVEALTSTTVDVNPDDFQGLRGTQGNIVLEAEVQPADENLNDVVFLAGDISAGEEFSTTPRFGSARSQIRIPSDLLMERAQADGSEMVSAVNIAMMNLEEFLPESVINETENNATAGVRTVAAAIVLSSQIVTSNSRQTPASGTFNTNAELVFTTNPVERASNPRCAFWNFGTTVAESGWSTDGVTTMETAYDEETKTFHVICQSQHLTSFCVLVDVTGEQLSGVEAQALEIVSYVGSGISMFFLIITIIFFLSYRKELFTSVHYFIHLNLAIALFLGYAAFVGGIETAASSEVGCVFVAALLQYLFVSVFCWMLCEGIMLYLLLVVVFSNAAKRWWMFLLIGWGLPIIVVAVSVGVAHDQYGVRDDEGELQYCWIGVERGAIWGFVAPMLAVIVINTIMWLLALRALFKVTAAKMKDQQGVLARKLFQAAVVLLPLLGLTWVFGLLSVNSSTTVFSWLFAIFNSFQGLFVFIFHVLRNEKVWKKLCAKPKSAVSRTATTTSQYQSSVKKSTTKKKKKTTLKKTKKHDDLLLSSDAVIVFENPDWQGGPFEVKGAFDEIDLTTRTWVD